MIVVVMGVSGSGKTTVGRALAQALRWPFYDADDFHPPENVAKMAGGTPLTDEDRWPWLDRVAQLMHEVEASEGNVVVACSALRQVYRDRLATAGDVRFVFLDGDSATIGARLVHRRHAYMPATLLASQFATLEPPHQAVHIDVRRSVPEQVAEIRRALIDAPASRAGTAA